MKVALFIPCYIDQFYPNVGIAALQLLDKLGCDVTFPLEQTCCGQPMANSGFASLSKGCDKNFVKNFAGFDYIVAPSGSCVLHVKEHLQDSENPQTALHIRNSVYELTEFLTDILKVESIDANFPFKVGLHNSCHGQRGLHLSSMTERVLSEFSKPEQLLKMVNGITLSKPKRNDECCGFGGTFCVFEEAVSVKMGKDRVKEHEDNKVDYITGGDTSCLMHLDGILKRNGSKVKTIHIAEILNNSL
ncbi:(Fe-S)-binding protein [Flavobacterium sp. 2]|uniref:(Fe-S)-binding protein n=1 Tax=Flavobacterium sp. 2 TaxID=308053 RepID=UPI000C1881C4|nr:(Fe-S)-binding protein [Flavobacterium sp. 2]PIF70746.1 L-lactate dehydrogenase complex protein LldE [Flavobacterium sp. 2]